MKKVALILAMDLKRGIGKGNKLPWRLKKEMKHFVDITLSVTKKGKQNAVLMGRKTWESIPEKFRPLKGRLNLVLTTNTGYKTDGAIVISSFEEAFENLGKEIETLFIIGGASLYEQALEKGIVDEIYLTQIHKEFGCDTFFSKIPLEFTEKESLSKDEEDDVEFEFFKISKK